MKGGLKDFDFYKLVCKTDETIYYIGSTSNIKERSKTHRDIYNNPNNRSYNAKPYKIIRANGGFDNFKFINLGNIKNVTKNEAHHTEQAFINLFKPNMNTRNSYLTDKEKKEQQKEQGTNYRENNREHYTQYQKEWCEKNYKHKKEQQKEYYNKNKDEMNLKKNQKITCECGCESRRGHIARHRKSQKHIKLMEELVTKNK